MKELNHPQLSSLSADGFVRVIEQGSGGAFPALLSSLNLAPITTNANGSYVRIGALQVCFGTSTQSIAASIANGNIFRSTTLGITFPAEFSSAPNFSVDTYSGLLWASPNGAPTTTGASVILMAGASTASASHTMDWIAIGPWQ